MHIFKRFLRHERGQFAVISALLSVPLVAAAGLAVDYSRHVTAKSHLQQMADAASLSLASGEVLSADEAVLSAGNVISANNGRDRVQNVAIVDVDANENYVDITLTADIPATFTGVLGYDRLRVSAYARAERATKGSVEVSLILDNTWSMSERDDKGVSKIQVLKTAAKNLVTELMAGNSEATRIALVPYGDYVNVGTRYRGQAWLDIPAEYTVPPTEKTCETRTSKDVCVARAPTYPCTKVTDGIEEPTTCGGGCTKYETQTVAPYQYCTGGSAAKYYKWWGCVGSRMTGTTRLDDSSPSVRYPGYLDTSQKCLNPIVPLSTDKAELLRAVEGMVLNIGSYKPNTYIPAGLIWGLNTLSPTAPLTEGAAYDPGNTKPRKVAVLMTDGENTLKFRSSDGRHVAFNSNADKAREDRKKTDDDTREICRKMKAKGIEIYSVAFMVDDDLAKEVLEACATDADHYFDASDASMLVAAFGTIARSLQLVRLAR